MRGDGLGGDPLYPLKGQTNASPAAFTTESFADVPTSLESLSHNTLQPSQPNRDTNEKRRPRQ